MDTAVIKSWNEVLRLTDPLIWNLAMDMDESHELGHCNGGIGIGNGSNGLHGNNGQSNGTIISHAQLKHSPSTLLPSKDSLSPSSSPPSSSSTSSSTSPSNSPSSPGSSHLALNYCRSLLDPHPKNALDWLKCLVIQTTDSDKDSSHETQKKELRSLLSRTSVDLGPAGAAITKRTGVPMSTSSSLSYNQGAAERIAGSSSGTGPTTTTATTTTTITTTSTTSPSSTPSRRVSPHAKPKATSISLDASISPEATYAPSVGTNPVTGGQGLASSLSPPSDCETDSMARPSANSIDISTSPSEGVSSSILSTKTATSEGGVVSTANPGGPSALVHAAGLAIQRQLIQSKNATVAFFYRTFSPTYRVSNLYIDSWSNGSQLRGLARIKTSVVRGDAFTLIRSTTVQMKDVWHQVLAARASQKKTYQRQKEREAAKREEEETRKEGKN
ncbi:hypothetical protein MVEG_06855 [Podila verticillata NRRL 6337]|nr:hypothetical protein MVEG_06855 [Podila verticillata NRRL 6337]